MEKISIINGDRLKIEFQDGGTGISEKNLKNLFIPYYTTKKRRFRYRIIFNPDNHQTSLELYYANLN